MKDQQCGVQCVLCSVLCCAVQYVVCVLCCAICGVLCVVCSVWCAVQCVLCQSGPEVLVALVSTYVLTTPGQVERYNSARSKWRDT